MTPAGRVLLGRPAKRRADDATHQSPGFTTQSLTRLRWFAVWGAVLQSPHPSP
jgi:hypothetical protein